MLDLFEKYQANPEKLQVFGFKKRGEEFVYSQEMMNGDFLLQLKLQGEKLDYQVLDQETGDEYVQVKMEQMMGEFVGQVREACQEIFLMIRTNCFDEVGFLYEQSRRLQEYVARIYDGRLEYLWENSSKNSNLHAGVFRHQDTKKWYGAFLTTDWSKFEVDGSGTIEVLNVKNDHVVELIQRKGIYPAFHMNKKYWLSLPLDDTLTDTELFFLLDKSFELTQKK
ncbi:MmcQ/YjbR family DNA-binding protein [Streptococcus anginosus]|uniref:MmcQ/YjbR family DNA-binding protein n=1 Tax=Streptococcus anginosus TaxID=1328 RepID=UPI000FF466E0|nr:MmcQ/YjbR family DNA-binding protein [Streptococcus anginosus]RHE83923.1 MmcQ/YjbR family DNA-binding protein [Streptococcus anginosus]